MRHPCIWQRWFYTQVKNGDISSRNELSVLIGWQTPKGRCGGSINNLGNYRPTPAIAAVEPPEARRRDPAPFKLWLTPHNYYAADEEPRMNMKPIPFVGHGDLFSAQAFRCG
jgi:hypothetical protein